MDRYYEKKCHAHAETYWWFVGRHHLVAELLKGLENCRILDVGCAGGALLSHLRNEGFLGLYGIDISKKAVALCKKRGFGNVYAHSAEKTPFGTSSFDAVAASDVLEHVKNDSAAIREWKRILKPGGRLLLFVPAFQSLWSSYDEVLHHFRRYDRARLLKLLKKNGFKIDRVSYWNSIVFLPALVSIALRNLTCRKIKPKELADNLFGITPILNSALTSLIKLENLAILRGINLPIGISLMLVARKKEK